MPRTERHKARAGTFAVSPWMDKDDYSHSVSEVEHRVVECSTLLVSSLDQASPCLEVDDCGHRTEIIQPEESDLGANTYQNLPVLDGEECVVCFRLDGTLVGIAGTGNQLGISGKVFEVSNTDCTMMDCASYPVLLQLYCSGAEEGSHISVWLAAESFGGDAMCLRSPMVDLSHQDVFGALVSKGTAQMGLHFSCERIVDCEEQDKEYVQVKLSDAIHNERIRTWAIDQVAMSSHINIGTLVLSHENPTLQ